jgi:hypothetical protein
VKEHHAVCPAPSCLLAHFLDGYNSSKRRAVSNKPFVDNYDKVMDHV